LSLDKQLTTKPSLELQIGDVFVKGGSPWAQLYRLGTTSILATFSTAPNGLSLKIN